jgi:Na+/phosphate symporter
MLKWKRKREKSLLGHKNKSKKKKKKSKKQKKRRSSEKLQRLLQKKHRVSEKKLQMKLLRLNGDISDNVSLRKSD